MTTASTKLRVRAGRPRLLLVEDDRDTSGVLSVLLAGETYEVCAVGDGLAALDVVHGLVPAWGECRNLPGRPDLIALDLCMPQMDGWEFLAALRSDRAVKDIPVVVMTAQPVESLRVRELHVPALQKPYVFEELLEALRKNLSALVGS